MINLFLLLLTLGCSTHRTAISGTVDVIEGDWCTVEVDNDDMGSMWVNIRNKKMKNIKEGDKVVFYIKVEGEIE